MYLPDIFLRTSHLKWCQCQSLKEYFTVGTRGEGYYFYPRDWPSECGWESWGSLCEPWRGNGGASRVGLWFVSVWVLSSSLFSCVGVSQEPPATPVIETPDPSDILRQIRRLRQQIPSAEVSRDRNVKDYLNRDHRYLECEFQVKTFAKKRFILLCPIYKQITIKIGPIYYCIYTLFLYLNLAFCAFISNQESPRDLTPFSNSKKWTLIKMTLWRFL